MQRNSYQIFNFNIVASVRDVNLHVFHEFIITILPNINKYIYITLRNTLCCITIIVRTIIAELLENVNMNNDVISQPRFSLVKSTIWFIKFVSQSLIKSSDTTQLNLKVKKSLERKTYQSIYRKDYFAIRRYLLD